jgi:RNA polymerase sigma factor (sigma-70 family)
MPLRHWPSISEDFQLTPEEMESLITSLRIYATARARAELKSRLPHQVLIDEEDIVNDAFQELFRNADELEDRPLGEISGLLKAIISRTVTKSFRRISHQERNTEFEPLPELSDERQATDFRQIEDRESVTELMRAMARLPSMQRDVFRMLYIEQRSIEEVARTLGKTTSAIHGLKRRALTLLRKIIHNKKLRRSTVDFTSNFLRHNVAHAFSIIVDADINIDLLADFLTELSSLYSDLSGGDELVIREGKIPVEASVLT